MCFTSSGAIGGPAAASVAMAAKRRRINGRQPSFPFGPSPARLWLSYKKNGLPPARITGQDKARPAKSTRHSEMEALAEEPG